MAKLEQKVLANWREKGVQVSDVSEYEVKQWSFNPSIASQLPDGISASTLARFVAWTLENPDVFEFLKEKSGLI
jgi:hypothetical protein